MNRSTPLHDLRKTPTIRRGTTLLARMKRIGAITLVVIGVSVGAVMIAASLLAVVFGPTLGLSK